MLQIPLNTKLALSYENPTGKLILGIAIFSKQKVRWHNVHEKWTCEASPKHSQPRLQREYFIDPDPSSML